MKHLPMMILAALLLAGCSSGYKQYKRDQQKTTAKDAMDYIRKVDSLTSVINSKFVATLSKLDTSKFNTEESGLVIQIRTILAKKTLSGVDLAQANGLIVELQTMSKIKTDK